VRARHELGADINAREEHGATPAYVAASRNFVDALYLLDDLGGSVNLPTTDGSIPQRRPALRGSF
jgi:hypothetical protein